MDQAYYTAPEPGACTRQFLRAMQCAIKTAHNAKLQHVKHTSPDVYTDQGRI